MIITRARLAVVLISKPAVMKVFRSPRRFSDLYWARYLVRPLFTPGLVKIAARVIGIIAMVTCPKEVDPKNLATRTSDSEVRSVEATWPSMRIMPPLADCLR